MQIVFQILLDNAVMVIEMMLSIPIGAFALGCIRMCADMRRDDPQLFRPALVFTLMFVVVYLLLLGDFVRRIVSA